jgi:hypothetical protein
MGYRQSKQPRAIFHPMRQPIKGQRLGDLEGEFRSLLISCLNECQNGRWGLFGQNNYVDAAKYLDWKDGQQLREAALQIRELRAEFGQPNPLVERFLHYCSMRGPNVLGEPKLAKALLDEIQSGDFDSRLAD